MPETRPNPLFVWLRWMIWAGVAAGCHVMIFGIAHVLAGGSGGMVVLMEAIYLLGSLYLFSKIERSLGVGRSQVILRWFAFQWLAAFVAFFAVPGWLNAVDRGKQNRSMADIRRIGNEVERYSEIHRAYPDALDVGQLEKRLDSRRDSAAEEEIGPQTICFEADIVFQDGQFVRWPEGKAR